MPAYAAPFETFGHRLGGTLGAGVGAPVGAAPGIMGRLSELLAPLDLPRQSLWNAFAAPVRAAETGDWSQLLGAIPGAAGAILGGAVGGPLGVLAGSALGGTLQGAGNMTENPAFQAPTVQDLTGTDDFWTNLLVGAVTDPLTYAGLGHGWRTGANTGARVGRTVGENLEAAANFRGPNYPGGLEKVVEAGADWQAMKYLDDPRLLGEMPPGSQYLGSGAQTDAFLRPPDAGGGVLSFTKRSPDFERTYGVSQGPAGGPVLPRADTPILNQAVRSAPIGTVRAEVSPRMIPGQTLLDNIPDDLTPTGEWEQMAAMLGQKASGLQDDLLAQGMKTIDLYNPRYGVNAGNLGIGAGGKWQVLDPGSIHPLDLTGNPIPRVPEMPMQEPTMIQNLLLRLLGSDKAVRAEIAERLARAGTAPQLDDTLLRALQAGDEVALSPTIPRARLSSSGIEAVEGVGSSLGSLDPLEMLSTMRPPVVQRAGPPVGPTQRFAATDPVLNDIAQAIAARQGQRFTGRQSPMGRVAPSGTLVDTNQAAEQMNLLHRLGLLRS